MPTSAQVCSSRPWARTMSTAGVTPGGFLGQLDAGGLELGIVVSAGLAGSAVTATIATLTADRIGRQRVLVLTSILGAVGTNGGGVAIGNVDERDRSQVTASMTKQAVTSRPLGETRARW